MIEQQANPWGQESRVAIWTMAAAYARCELAPGDAREFEHRFRAHIEFRRVAAVKLLGAPADAEEEVVFAAVHPHLAQFNLRRRVWRGSPFRAVFPGFDAGSMRMLDEEERECALDDAELEDRLRSVADLRVYWGAGRSYDFTYDELRGDDPAYAAVRDAIRDGADRYFMRSLTRSEEMCFEQWFIRSRDFRMFVIPYLATADRRVYTTPYEFAEFLGQSRWDGRAKAGMCQFKYERSTRKQLAAALRMWSPICARLGLPEVDLRIGALLLPS